MAAAVVVQSKPRQSHLPLRRSLPKRRPSRVIIEAMESATRNESLASIDESNEPTKTSEEGDTNEIDVGTEQVTTSKKSSKDDATEIDKEKLSSTERNESLMGDIDVGEDAIPEPKPSRTQQAIPDVSSDARLDIDLGRRTAQIGVRNSRRSRFAKVQSLFSNKVQAVYLH